jgi:hypothetical protein
MEVEKYFVNASPELRIVESVILEHPPRFHAQPNG